MEKLFSSSIRVLCNLDDAAELLATFQELESNLSAATTEERLDLLNSRYWGRISYPEEDVRLDCYEDLKLVSEEHYSQTVERLENFRTSFYAEYEADALKNAEVELLQRTEEIRETQDREDLERMLESGHTWLRQLCPQWKREDPERQESQEQKQTTLFHWAHVAIGSSIQIRSQWYLERLDQPSRTGGDESFLATVNQLRKHFDYLRFLPPVKQTPYLRLDLAAGKFDATQDGITESILRNMFLFLDHDAAASVLDTRRPGDKWIWAVDPDFDPESRDSDPRGYQGYVRVRLQQLLNHFYVARCWHADEWSMDEIWKAAQKDPYNSSFVSMNDEDIFAPNIASPTERFLLP
ncbi:hypothetical protein N7522_002049 [Penicillium canescens]|nr:hypothetical protein N7522_002049 [Penicillium canescens]